MRREFLHFYPADGDPYWRFNANFTQSALRNWLNWKPWNLGFRQYFNDVLSRDGSLAYLSYPPFPVFVPWVISVCFGAEPTLFLLSVLTQTWHFLLSLALAGWGFVTLRGSGAGRNASAILAITAGAICLLHPSLLGFYVQGWWADLVALPLYFAAMALELERERWESSAAARWVFFFLLTACVFTDWFCLILVICLIVKRATDETNLPRGWSWIVTPPALLAAYQVYTVTRVEGWTLFLATIAKRSGIRESRVFARFDALGMLFGPFGQAAFLVFFVSLPIITYFFFRRTRMRVARKRLVESLFLLLVPAFIHLFLLREHYEIHHYEWLKFGLIAIAGAAVLVPAAVVAGWPERSFGRVFAIAVPAMALACVPIFFAGYEGLASSSKGIAASVGSDCEALSAKYRSGEILVSPQFFTYQFHHSVPNGLPFSVKGRASHICFGQVGYADDPERLIAILHLETEIDHLPRPAGVRLVLRSEPSEVWRPYLTGAKPEAAGSLKIFELDSAKLLGEGDRAALSR